MLNLSSLLTKLRRRWSYGLLSTLVALGLILGTPGPSHALPWFDLIFRGIQIIQISNLSDRQEVALGQRINQQLTSREFRVYRGDPSINEYVDQIGQQLVPTSSRPNIPYVFQVVDNPQVNAFATMGGYVYVTTGLMRAADNEAQLASVLTHEIGHIGPRHAVQQMRQQAIAQGVASVAGLDRNTAVAIGVDLALRRPNSRQDEFEADRLGLANLRDAGYAPIGAINFMEKLVSQRTPPTVLSTHPAPADRITVMRSQIDPETAGQGAGLDGPAYRERIRRLL